MLLDNILDANKIILTNIFEHYQDKCEESCESIVVEWFMSRKHLEHLKMILMSLMMIWLRMKFAD